MDINDGNMHITVMDENSNEIECEIVMFYDCLENGLKYVFYTDNEVDEEGNLNMFASRFLDLDGDEVQIGDIESEEEWALLDDVLDKAREGLNG